MLEQLPRRHDRRARQTVIARREVMHGRGRDVRTHWLELRHDAGVFRVAIGSHWHQERGRERTVHSTPSLREAVAYANRRIHTINARHATELAAEPLEMIEIRRTCTAQGLLAPVELAEDLAPDLYETLFA